MCSVSVRVLGDDGKPMLHELSVFDAETGEKVDSSFSFFPRYNDAVAVELAEGTYYFVVKSFDWPQSSRHILFRRELELTDRQEQDICFDLREMPRGFVRVLQSGFDGFALFSGVTLEGIKESFEFSCSEENNEFVLSPGVYRSSFSWLMGKWEASAKIQQYVHSVPKLLVQADRNLELGPFERMLDIDLGSVKDRYKRGESIEMKALVRIAKRGIGSSFVPTFHREPVVRVFDAAGEEVHSATGWAFEIPVDWKPGLYTIEVSVDTGLHQGMMRSSRTFEVQAE